MQSQTSNTLRGSKTNIIHDTTITLDIVTAFPKDTGSYTPAEMIAQQVFDRVHGLYNILNIDAPFRIVTSELELDETLEENTENEIIVRRLMRFQHLVDQQL